MKSELLKSKDMYPISEPYPYRFVGMDGEILSEGVVECHCMRDAYLAAMVEEEYPINHQFIQVMREGRWVSTIMFGECWH